MPTKTVKNSYFYTGDHLGSTSMVLDVDGKYFAISQLHPIRRDLHRRAQRHMEHSVLVQYQGAFREFI